MIRALLLIVGVLSGFALIVTGLYILFGVGAGLVAAGAGLVMVALDIDIDGKS